MDKPKIEDQKGLIEIDKQKYEFVEIPRTNKKFIGNIYGNHFTVNNAFSILQAVCQEGIWATRVSFVYSAEENAVYYVQNNNFSQIGKYEF